MRSMQREIFALPEIEISPVRHLSLRNTRAVLPWAPLMEKSYRFCFKRSGFFSGKSVLFAYDGGEKRISKSGIGAKLKWRTARNLSEKRREFYQMDISARAGAKRFFQS